MSDPFEDRSLPRGALLGAAALVTLTLAGALFGRLADMRPRPAAAVVETRELRFADRADGAVVVTEAATAKSSASWHRAPTASCAASCAAWRRNGCGRDAGA